MAGEEDVAPTYESRVAGVPGGENGFVYGVAGASSLSAGFSRDGVAECEPALAAAESAKGDGEFAGGTAGSWPGGWTWADMVESSSDKPGRGTEGRKRGEHTRKHE